MIDSKDIYGIQRPLNNCLLCGADIIDQEKHPSLIDKSDEDTIRKDYCFNCWEKIENKKYFSFWVAKRIKPGPDRRTTRAERNRSLLQLFLSLYNSDQQRFRSHLFILSHLLMRYQVFKWKETKFVEKTEQDESQLDAELPTTPDIGSQPTNISIEPEQSPSYQPANLIVFERRETGEEYIVEDVSLDDESLIEIKKEIDSITEIKEQ